MMSDAILRINQVMKKTALGKTNVYKKVGEKTFPAPVPLGDRAKGWLESEVDKWIQERKLERDNLANAG